MGSQQLLVVLGAFRGDVGWLQMDENFLDSRSSGVGSSSNRIEHNRTVAGKQMTGGCGVKKGALGGG